MTKNYEAPASVAPSQKTIEQGAAFIGGLFAHAAVGLHVATISAARSVEKAVFSKSADGEILIDEENHHTLFESVLVAIELDGVFGVSLRSTAVNAPVEVRGWVVTSFSIRPLTAEEVIESYCVDHETGKITSPERNVVYSDGWSIESVTKSA